MPEITRQEAIQLLKFKLDHIEKQLPEKAEAIFMISVLLAELAYEIKHIMHALHNAQCFDTNRMRNDKGDVYPVSRSC